MWGQSLNTESNDSRDVTGLTHVAKNTLISACVLTQGGEEMMLQSRVIPVKPNFRPYFIPFITLLAGCVVLWEQGLLNGGGEQRLLKGCEWPCVKHVWQTLLQGLEVPHLPTLGSCHGLACHSVVLLQAQRVDMDVLTFARCSCEIWPRKHSTACFSPSVRVQWLSFSASGQAALWGNNQLRR